MYPTDIYWHSLMSSGLNSSITNNKWLTIDVLEPFVNRQNQMEITRGNKQGIEHATQ